MINLAVIVSHAKVCLTVFVQVKWMVILQTIENLLLPSFSLLMEVATIVEQCVREI